MKIEHRSSEELFRTGELQKGTGSYIVASLVLVTLICFSISRIRVAVQ
ncbi:hypothetical protein ACOCEA_07115 [Maribacter sp. CXY002]